MFSRWFRTFLCIALVAVCAIPVHAHVQSMVLEDRLDGLLVRETITIAIAQNTLSSLALGLPRDAQDVTIDGVAATVRNDTLEIPLDCTECRVSVSYSLADAVAVDAKDTFVYSRTLNLPESPDSLTYRVVLPPGTFIVDQTAGVDPSIVPQASAIKTDGTSIIIEWSSLSPQLPVRYFVRFSSHEVTEDVGAEVLTELAEWPFWTVAILAFLLGIVLGTVLQRYRTKEMETTLPYVPVSLLSPDERTVMAILEEHKTIMQKELGKRLGWSKSKVSAIVTNLDHKGIIEREKIGRNYRITLLKEMGD